MIKAVSLGFQQLIDTLKHITHLKVVGLFLCAYWLYIDGVNTIFRMGIDYGMSLGFPAGSLITALLMIQFVSFPAALLYNRMGSRIGIKNALLIAIGGYSCITFMGYFMNALWQFFTLAALIGLFQGGIQALSRSLYTRIIPSDEAAEFFGFYNLIGKLAAIIGPAMMGIITLWTGNIRYGILSILVLLIPGAFLLMKVDIGRGEEIARDYLKK
jgi:UMF1 family MFS transporter